MSFEELEEYYLGNLADITSSKRIFLSDYSPTGIPFYRSKEIIQKSLGEESNEILFISKEKYVAIKERFGSPIDGDLLLSAVGERAGIPYVVRNQGDFYFKDGNLIWFRNVDKKLDIDYLCYWLKSNEGKHKLNGLMIGSAQKALTIIGLKKLNVYLPTVSVQRRIASILSSLDDKIELNRQTNQTLEAIAQALFKEWFVNFNFPGATGEMQDSELGEIPKGWRVDSLLNTADFLNGLALQKFPPEDETNFLRVIKIRELKSGFSNSSDKASKTVPEKFIVDDGDLLFSWSGTLEVRFWIGGKGVLNQHLFKVTSLKYPKWFCYLWILHHLAEFRRIAEDKTTTMGHIQRKHLTEALCLIPDNINIMNACISPIIEHYIITERQTQTLTQLRDTLLPKLMKGEITIPESEKLTAAAL